MPLLIIITGPQGSGKTTLARALVEGFRTSVEVFDESLPETPHLSEAEIVIYTIHEGATIPTWAYDSAIQWMYAPFFRTAYQRRETPPARPQRPTPQPENG